MFVTGQIAGRLAELRSVRQSLLDAAADYLASRFTPDRVRGFAWRPLAAYARLLRECRARRAATTCSSGAAASSSAASATRRFDAVQRGADPARLRAASIPGAKLTAQELVLALQASRRADGSWPLLDGGHRDARVQRRPRRARRAGAARLSLVG